MTNKVFLIYKALISHIKSSEAGSLLVLFGTSLKSLARQIPLSCMLACPNAITLILCPKKAATVPADAQVTNIVCNIYIKVQHLF